MLPNKGIYTSLGAPFLLAEFVENAKDGQPFWIEDGKIALRKKIGLVKQSQVNSSDHNVALFEMLIKHGRLMRPLAEQHFLNL